MPARWVTRAHLHLDRVATPWLIRRFVDPSATFDFVDWGTHVEEDDETIPFGMPDVALSPQHGGTTFAAVMRRFDLDSPSLLRMERLVAAGVAIAMGRSLPAGLTDDEVALANALNQLGAGYGVAYRDEEHLEHGMALYEAVYVLCSLADLSPSLKADMPKALPDRVAYLRDALPDVRPIPDTRHERN
ncbi:MULTISPECIES: chromate resistance protein ChrB domain-containing protein [unclassified Mycobacterium]|uniref:chromate resistance protein ChrB domain-containing protein n=1 Tax=unclassified Mycobacterium TaxID=2642494 RepID=UPI0029C95FE8|nr:MULTISPECIES: chromate resistance protein ChrB domain-containing protein [unclassified Mycobacterium]